MLLFLRWNAMILVQWALKDHMCHGLILRGRHQHVPEVPEASCTAAQTTHVIVYIMCVWISQGSPYVFSSALILLVEVGVGVHVGQWEGPKHGGWGVIGGTGWGKALVSVSRRSQFDLDISHVSPTPACSLHHICTSLLACAATHTHKHMLTQKVECRVKEWGESPCNCWTSSLAFPLTLTLHSSPSSSTSSCLSSSSLHTLSPLCSVRWTQTRCCSDCDSYARNSPH